MLSNDAEKGQPEESAALTCPSPMSVHEQDISMDEIAQDVPALPNSGPPAALVIDTKFDLDQNKKSICRGLNARQRYRETQRQRKHAALAVVPESLND